MQSYFLTHKCIFKDHSAACFQKTNEPAEITLSTPVIHLYPHSTWRLKRELLLSADSTTLCLVHVRRCKNVAVQLELLSVFTFFLGSTLYNWVCVRVCMMSFNSLTGFLSSCTGPHLSILCSNWLRFGCKKYLTAISTRYLLIVRTRANHSV